MFALKRNTYFHILLPRSTWTEFASDVNGKKLSKLIGQNDEEKLAQLCNIIEEQVQKLNPYQPIASSQLLVKLCCRNVKHNKQPVLDICPGHLIDCLSMYYRFHPCAFFQIMVCCAAIACMTIATQFATSDQ
jgi:hypothetical protein